jgi:predicted porin
MTFKPFALAITALCSAGAASAQSSVTLYGVADIGLAKITDKRTQLVSSGTQNNGTSRWGIRGSEDLGGGMKASFNFEAQVGLLDGAGASAPFSRQANMSLGGSWGTVKAGRALTPSWYGVMAWELTGSANYAVVNSQFGYGGMNSRHNAELSYTSPSLNGFSVTLGHLFGPNNGNVAKNDVNVIYKGGPLSASLVYNKTDGKGKNMGMGASYDFGGFKLAGSWHDATGGGLGKGFTVGGSLPVGPFRVTVDLARDTHKKDTDSLIELKYDLSKRTTVYGLVLHNGAGKAAKSVNSTMLGIRHNF